MALLKELTVEANIQNVSSVINFVENCLEEINCPVKTIMQINIAMDELFSNVANYAYNGSVGDMTVIVEQIDGGVKITRIDSGEKYNLLEAKDPDVTLGVEERQLGGLGVFLVKNVMDSISYDYVNNQNIVVVTKMF